MDTYAELYKRIFETTMLASKSNNEEMPHTRYECICEAGTDVIQNLLDHNVIDMDTYCSMMAVLPVICVEADNRFDNEYYEKHLKPWILDHCRHLSEFEAHDYTFRHLKEEYGDLPITYIMGLADHLIGYRG